MIQTVDELRAMVTSVVKVIPNSDPTKTQGSRLRQLLYNILDSVDDLVEKQGLSISSEIMNEVEGKQDLAINQLRAEVEALIEAIPDHSIYALKNDIVTYDLSPYLKKTEAFNGDYNNLNNKPVIPTLNFKLYNSSGIVNQVIKKWVGIVTPTIANGFNVDISSAGFSTILGIQVQVERNTANTNDIPIVSIKNKSNTSISFNIAQTNAATVSILGINVLSGLPLIFASNLNTITLHIEVIGY